MTLLRLPENGHISVRTNNTEKRNPLCLCRFFNLAIFDLIFLCQFFVL